MSFPDFDPRVNNIELAISFVEEYFKLVESKMEEAKHSEMTALDASYPPDIQQQHYGEYSALKRELEYSYDRLVSISRYSIVVLLHMIVETQMRAFCLELQKEKKKGREKDKQGKLPSRTFSDFRGGPIEQSKLYLTKIVGISLEKNPKWDNLMTLQKVRDCIIHAYGDVSRSRDQEYLRKLVQQGRYIEIDVDGKLIIRRDFCEDQIKNFSDFFKELCTKAGWRVAS
ncbi:MAG: hypothetical protein ACREOI_02270 [bacterium]